MSKWQIMQISGERADNELSHMNLHYLQERLIAFDSEMINFVIVLYEVKLCYKLKEDLCQSSEITNGKT